MWGVLPRTCRESPPDEYFYMQWFKLYGAEMLADPKYQRLNASERSCWITLLCLASLNEGIVNHCEESYLISHSGIEPSEMGKAHGVLVKFEMLGMVTLGRDSVTGVPFLVIKNWQKRQNVYSESYERVKRFRAKNKGIKASSPVTVVTLPSNVRVEKNRIEKNNKEQNFSIKKFRPTGYPIDETN